MKHTNWKKNIILFLISQTVSLFGTSLVQYAIMWYITLKTQSGVMMAISIICGFLPTFFLSPFAGVWADRHNRKMLIVLSDSVIAGATLILAILFFMGFDAMYLLFVAAAVRSLGTAVQTPTVSALLPQLVPEEQLTKINGINGSIQAGIMLLSPVVSGALLTMASLEAVFFVDVVTAVIAILTLVLFVHIPSHEKAAEKQQTSYFTDMILGYRYIKGHGYILKFFLFMGFFMFLVTPAAFLTPLQVTRSFGPDVWRLTAIEIVFSLGMMLGGLVIASWAGFPNRVHTMTWSCLLIGAGTLALGAVPTFWIYLIMMGVVGFAIPMFNTPGIVILQERVEPDYLGRVFGIITMISSTVMPLGMLLFGPLSDMMPIEWLLVGTGILIFIQAFFLVGSRELVESGKRIAKADEEVEG